MVTVTWRREQSPHAEVSRGLARWLDRRRQDRWDEQHAASLVERFLAAAYGAGLCRDTESCAGLPGLASPRVLSVVLGDPDRLLVQMMSAQLVRDYEAVADRLAEGLGVPRVRIRVRSHGLIWIELLRRDPLAEPVMLPTGISSVNEQRVVLVGCETGEELSVCLREVAHIIAQGQTRSGKSRWTYGFLAQIAGCQDVLIAGSDITGLIARAFEHTRHAPYWASGSGDIERHADVLEQLVAEMDRRNAAMPPRLDVFPTSVDDPQIWVVVEELAGLIEAAEAVDALNPAPKTGRGAVPRLKDRIKGAYKRLMAEGAKAGMHVLLLVQRAEAGIVGGFARGQASLRITFRVDDVESVKMLHSNVDRVAAEMHSTAESGIALLSGPGLPLLRGRAPHMPDYATFIDLIADACAQPALATATPSEEE